MTTMIDIGTTWEYKAVNLAKHSGPNLENMFNKLGAEGWEYQATELQHGYAIFKRPVERGPA